MKSTASVTYEVASAQWQFDAIHRLNYRTFVDEIPQHRGNPDKVLVDKFHRENTYIVALRGGRLVGMIAVRAKRPFSLDQKLQKLDAYLPPSRAPCEIRLLAVDRKERSGMVFYGLICALSRHCRAKGYDLAVISGTVRQLKLYRHLGFVPFGHLVGAGEAKFQPMYITAETMESRLQRKSRGARKAIAGRSPVNYLPGPVAVHRAVRRRLSETPVSHRADSFVADFKATQQLLTRLVGAKHVEILMGSGTLGNDAIAAQLSLLSAPGLVLSNGEFGERLVDHARRFGLTFEVLRADWGDIFSPDAITDTIKRAPSIRWLWAVHCETSTGVLNDLERLKEICAENHLLLNMDCIGSIGAVPVNLAGVYLASAVSGKGLGAFPGLSMIFHEPELAPAPNRLPRYLDLGYYTVHDGIPFTFSSNLLYALRAALERFDARDRARVARLAAWLRAELRGMGLRIVGEEKFLSPAVTTVALPANVFSKEIGKKLEEAGYLLSYMSGYLVERNWLQVCLMGEVSQPQVRSLLEKWRRLTAAPPLPDEPSPTTLAHAS